MSLVKMKFPVCILCVQLTVSKKILLFYSSKNISLKPSRFEYMPIQLNHWMQFYDHFSFKSSNLLFSIKYNDTFTMSENNVTS